MQVRDVLADGRSVDVDAASMAISYPLHWQHVALNAWYPGGEPADNELARLQQFIRDLAKAVDTSASPLLATADPTSEWAWLPYRAAPGDIVIKIREFVRARPDAPNIAIGATGSGVKGFRRSRRQAQRARAAALARSGQQRVVVAATDPDIIAPALFAASLEEVGEWVVDVLGPLASDTDDDARLRKTLLEFLHFGSGSKAGAKELSMALHDLKHSVGQAVARRGRPIDDRLDVELALLACQRYGAAVLQPA
jgi:DNA-binding PucR family transcriptional regulator